LSLARARWQAGTKVWPGLRRRKGNWVWPRLGMAGRYKSLSRARKKKGD
jgi:hypothetical protein